MSARRHRIKPITHERSTELRKEATFPERLLWGSLRGRQLSGLKFRRQHPVGDYIVDFYCSDAKLVIEIDGESHEGRQEYDAKREAFIRSQGLEVVRYSNDEVLDNLDGVLQAIARHALLRRTQPSPNPSL